MAKESKLRNVEATVRYISRKEKFPVFYIGVPKSAQTTEPPTFEKPTIKIHDVRQTIDEFSLEKNGFEYKIGNLPPLDFLDRETVIEKYYPNSENLVAESTGASRVIAFDHNVRDYELASTDNRVDNPVRFVHNDYTETSAPQRVKDLFGSESGELLKKRYAFINVWRPLRGPVLDFPLAVIDSTSLTQNDFVESELRYNDRVGHVYSIFNNPSHRWYYLNQMQEEDILLLKCFDSARCGNSRYTAHASFKHTDIQKPFLPRRSIETRTIAFF